SERPPVRRLLGAARALGPRQQERALPRRDQDPLGVEDLEERSRGRAAPETRERRAAPQKETTGRVADERAGIGMGDGADRVGDAPGGPRPLDPPVFGTAPREQGGAPRRGAAPGGPGRGVADTTPRG